MKGDARVIEYLNRGLRHDLTAVNQLWQRSRTLADWGYNTPADRAHVAATHGRITLLPLARFTAPPETWST